MICNNYPFYNTFYFNPLSNAVANPVKDLPPNLYQIMQSIVNFGAEEKTNPINLAEKASSKIFSFNYPLSENVNKTEFETNILEHFINRRIGFQTFTAFQVALKSKLNEIMPFYNKLFNEINFKIFDGESITRNIIDSRAINSTNINNNELEQQSTVGANNTTDMRHSDTPENMLQQIQSGEYMSTYDYNQSKNNSNQNSTSQGKDTSTLNSTDNFTENFTEQKTVGNKAELYYRMLEAKNNIYTQIYKDLEILFFQILDV